MKKVLSLLFVLALGLLVACGTKVEGVSINASTTQVKVGQTLTLNATVQPAKVEQGVTWSSSKSSVATVSADGVVKGIKAGKATITATSIADPTISQKITITITKEATGDDIDLGGYEVVIAYSPNSLYEMDPRLEYQGSSAPSADREYRKKAFEQVEDDFNCTITIKGYPVDTDSARWDYINQQATNGTTEFDIYWVPTKYLSNMAAGFIDMEDFYQEVAPGTLSTSDYFARVVKEQLKGWSYSDNSITSDDPVIGVNINLLREIGMEDQEPAKLYLEDKWSFSEFKQWVLDVQSALDSKYGQGEDKHYVITGMLNDYVVNMSRTSGVAICDPLTGTINLLDPIVAKAANLLRELQEQGCVDPANQPDAKSDVWNSGRGVLCYGTSYWVGYKDRWQATLWGEGDATQYAYSPFPYNDGLSNTTNRFATYTQDTFVMPLAITKKIEDSGIDSEDLTAKNIFKVWYSVYKYTKDLIQKDIEAGIYDEEAATLKNAQNKWHSDYSVEAWVSIQKRLKQDPSVAIFDPINELDNHWSSDYAEAVAGFIAPSLGYTTATDFAAAVTPFIQDLQQKFTTKYK